MFFLSNILCVHVRKLGTSVRKSMTKSDLQNLQNRCLSGRQDTHLSFREEMHESKVMDFVPSQALCMHSIAISRHGFLGLAVLAIFILNLIKKPHGHGMPCNRITSRTYKAKRPIPVQKPQTRSNDE